MTVMSFPREVLVCLYYILSRLVPPGRNECFISFPDVDDNAFPVYSELLRRGRLGSSLLWLAADSKLAKARLLAKLEPRFHAQIRVVKKNSPWGLWCFLRAKRVYFTHGHFFFARRGTCRRKLVNLWHGMPLKAIGMLDGKDVAQIQATDITIASSEFFRDIMAGAFRLNRSEVLVTGMPRCDQLASLGEVARKYRNEFLAGSENLIVWMPTYRTSTIGDVRADSVLDRDTLAVDFLRDLHELSVLAVSWRCAILVKLHPMDFLNTVSTPEFSNLTVVRSDSSLFQSVGIYDLLAAADGLITDVSSVCFDFMATRRPILITRNFINDYSRGLLFDPDVLFSAVFTSDGWGGAADFFRAVSSGELLPQDGLSVFCEFSDGLSSARLVKALEVLDECP